MKFILVLALAYLGQASSMPKHKSGGNCGILAGEYYGWWGGEDHSSGDCGQGACSGNMSFSVEDIDGTETYFKGHRSETVYCECEYICGCLAPSQTYSGNCSDSKVVFDDYIGEIQSNGDIYMVTSEGHSIYVHKMPEDV